MKRKHDIYLKIPVRKNKYNYKCIYPSKIKGKYIVFINNNNKREYLGLFDTIYDALIIYNEKAKQYNKEIQNYIGEEIYAT